MTKKINKSGSDTGKIAKMAKDLWDTSDALGSKIVAAQVCKDFCHILTPSNIQKLDDLEKNYDDGDETE